MDTNMFELVQKIFWVTSFIAIGGTLALMFLLVFAQSILGSRTIHKQLEQLRHDTEEVNRRLGQIVELLEKEQER